MEEFEGIVVVGEIAAVVGIVVEQIAAVGEIAVVVCLAAVDPQIVELAGQ